MTTIGQEVYEVDWFGGAEEPEFELGMRFYADGSIHHPSGDQADVARKRMRRYFAVQNQFRKHGGDGHEWRDRDGWVMVVRRSSRVIRTEADYRDGFQAWITHPDRLRRRKLERYIRTRMFPYRGQAVAEGLELLATHRLRRRARVAREARERMASEHGQAARWMADAFAGRPAVDVARLFAR